MPGIARSGRVFTFGLVKFVWLMIAMLPNEINPLRPARDCFTMGHTKDMIRLV